MTSTMAKALIAILLVIALASGAWVYKNVELQESQVLVIYLTGTQPQGEISEARGEAVFEPIRGIERGEPLEVEINGKTARCRVSNFDVNTQAIGPLGTGRLQNGAPLPLDGAYTFVDAYHISKGLNYGATELVNALEVAGCVVLSKHGTRLLVMDLNVA